MAVKKERRRRTRVPLSGPVALATGSKQLTAGALDIGAEGMSVMAPEKVRKGSEVSLEFGLPGSEGRFLIQAKVVRVDKKPGGFLLGLRFRTEGWVMAHVQEFVRDQLVKLARSKHRKAPEVKEPAQAPPQKPFHHEKQPEDQDDYKPNKMAIDLDGSERASEVARLFKEAMKKKD